MGKNLAQMDEVAPEKVRWRVSGIRATETACVIQRLLHKSPSSPLGTYKTLKLKKKKGRCGREGGMFTYTGRFGDLDLRGRLVAGKWLRRHRVDEVKIINLE